MSLPHPTAASNVVSDLTVYGPHNTIIHRFLGYVDLLGTTYSAPSIATGYGAYIAIPLLRAAVDGKQDQLTEENAKRLLHECMRVLFYRDARSLDKVRPLPDPVKPTYSPRAATVPTCDRHGCWRAYLRADSPGHDMVLCGGYPWVWRADSVDSNERHVHVYSSGNRDHDRTYPIPSKLPESTVRTQACVRQLR